MRPFLFLPYQIASVAVACILIQALCRHKLVDAIKNQTGAIFFYSFIVLEFIVSIFHSNWTGFGNTWLFVLIGLYGAYYRRSITKSTFEKMCDLIIILSVFAAIYGLYQFNQISLANGRTFLEFHIFNSPKRRITSTFMNANIYAMVIDFVCVNKIKEIFSWSIIVIIYIPLNSLRLKLLSLICLYFL